MEESARRSVEESLSFQIRGSARDKRWRRAGRPNQSGPYLGISGHLSQPWPRPQCLGSLSPETVRASSLSLSGLVSGHGHLIQPGPSLEARTTSGGRGAPLMYGPPRGAACAARRCRSACARFHQPAREAGSGAWRPTSGCTPEQGRLLPTDGLCRPERRPGRRPGGAAALPDNGLGARARRAGAELTAAGARLLIERSFLWYWGALVAGKRRAEAQRGPKAKKRARGHSPQATRCAHAYCIATAGAPRAPRHPRTPARQIGVDVRSHPYTSHGPQGTGAALRSAARTGRRSRHGCHDCGPERR